MPTTFWYPPKRIDLDAGEGGGVYIFYTHFAPAFSDRPKKEGYLCLVNESAWILIASTTASYAKIYPI